MLISRYRLHVHRKRNNHRSVVTLVFLLIDRQVNYLAHGKIMVNTLNVPFTFHLVKDFNPQPPGSSVTSFSAAICILCVITVDLVDHQS